MLSAAQVALFGAISANIVAAFSPVFSSPRQCETLRITWSEIDLPIVDMPLTEIFMSLIPLDNPSRIAPEPYTLSVPSGGHEINALPFPAGTQFFASAHLMGSAGFERRTVSKVFTVEHSDNSGCLPATIVPVDGRVKAKSFGKRQISVVGPSTVDATGIAQPVVSPSGSAPVASASSEAVPPIKVIGTSELPATGLPVPGNVAPVPSASGSVPAIEVIGTSFVSATSATPPEASSSGSSDAASNPTTTYAYSDSNSADATSTSTSCTETPTEMPEMPEMVTEWTTVTVTMSYDSNQAQEEPCDSSEHPSVHESTMPPGTITMTSLPSATSTADVTIVHYTVFDDMVNAANSMFKAWNPYKPAYTPST